MMGQVALGQRPGQIRLDHPLEPAECRDRLDQQDPVLVGVR